MRSSTSTSVDAEPLWAGVRSEGKKWAATPLWDLEPGCLIQETRLHRIMNRDGCRDIATAQRHACTGLQVCMYVCMYVYIYIYVHIIHIHNNNK